MLEHGSIVWEWRGQYGRLCALVASALANGHRPESVLEASRGKGAQVAPVYVKLRRQRKRCNETILRARAAGVADRDMVRLGRQARTAVEQEFMIDIPQM